MRCIVGRHQSPSLLLGMSKIDPTRYLDTNSTREIWLWVDLINFWVGFESRNLACLIFWVGLELTLKLEIDLILICQVDFDF